MCCSIDKYGLLYKSEEMNRPFPWNIKTSELSFNKKGLDWEGHIISSKNIIDISKHKNRSELKALYYRFLLWIKYVK